LAEWGGLQARRKIDEACFEAFAFGCVEVGGAHRLGVNGERRNASAQSDGREKNISAPGSATVRHNLNSSALACTTVGCQETKATSDRCRHLTSVASAVDVVQAYRGRLHCPEADWSRLGAQTTPPHLHPLFASFFFISILSTTSPLSLKVLYILLPSLLLVQSLRQIRLCRQHDVPAPYRPAGRPYGMCSNALMLDSVLACP
jgi:hypothetical protein